MRPIVLLLGAACAFASAACATPDAQPNGVEFVGPQPPDGRPVIAVQADAAGIPLDPRLFGTNVPAWVNPTNLGNADLRTATRALGTPLLRMPGGSWSNAYSWLACEMGDGNGCYWTWAARPTDFLNFARATDTEVMWTVSANGTAKEAAALVAFFNGVVGDTTLIGVDQKGKDWKRVGDWASLRAQHGNPEPFQVRLWEVGNEVYGGKQATGGSQCASWGWEDVWTCDGDEYMRGRGTGGFRHEGYLEFRAAMRAVDSSIQVGAVGVPKPGDWTDWGTKVFSAAGADLDFYVIHHYAFSEEPRKAGDIMRSSHGVWPEVMAANKVAADRSSQRTVPIAVTEYNLVSYLELDNGQFMTRSANALFLADMIGQMANAGVAMANQWNLVNGRGNNGSDYGLLDVDRGRRAPAYFALKLWTTMRGRVLPLSTSIDAVGALSVYATRADDGDIRVMAINKTGKATDVRIALVGEDQTLQVTSQILETDALESLDVLFNGIGQPSVDLSDAPARPAGVATGFLDHTFPPYSITVLRFTR